MILEEYTKEINESENTRLTAMEIAYKLNRDDPFNVYIIGVERASRKVFIEKQPIKGMK